jgi:hypothetical protein
VGDDEAWGVADGAAVAPRLPSISCRMARSSSVAASEENQSCSIPAPSPNGFSRLSFGPVTYPSSDMDISQITMAMGGFLSVRHLRPGYGGGQP